MLEQEATEYYHFLLQMECVEFEQELIEIVSINTIISLNKTTTLSSQ